MVLEVKCFWNTRASNWLNLNLNRSYKLRKRGNWKNWSFKIDQRLNWQYMPDSVNRIINHSVQPSTNLVLPKICQWSNFEPLDLSDYIVATSSIQSTTSMDWLTESGRFYAERLETTSFSPTLYILHHLRPFYTRKQSYIV